MLLTMEEACKRKYMIFPNPERIDKVETSMSNLESVVRERNKAYHLLETGVTGERPGKFVHNAIGRLFQIVVCYFILFIHLYAYVRLKVIFQCFPHFRLQILLSYA